MSLFDDFSSHVLTPESQSQVQPWFDRFAEECSLVTGIYADVTFDAFAADTLLDAGLAINPQSAAQCLLDSERSAVFLRGFYQALLDARARKPQQPVQVLYAGCGPFASLLLPLLPLLDLSAYQFTVLDIHNESLDSVQLLLDYFQFDAAQIQLLKADACHWRTEQSFEVIISEVMQKALEQEPQLAVTQNLQSLLAEDGVFIPENIEVQPLLAHWDVERAQINGLDAQQIHQALAGFERISLHAPISLSAESAMRWPLPGQVLRMAEFSLPELSSPADYDFLLCTCVQVYKQHWLYDYQCTLTLPSKCYEAEVLLSVQALALDYQTGVYPKFELVVLA